MVKVVYLRRLRYAISGTNPFVKTLLLVASSVTECKNRVPELETVRPSDVMVQMLSSIFLSLFMVIEAGFLV